VSGSSAGGAGEPDGGAGGPADDAEANDAAAQDALEATSPCSTAHLVCEDFDTRPPWDGWITQIASTSTIDYDPQRFVSPPASLHIAVQPGGATSHPTFLYRELPPARRIVATADVAVSLPSPAPDGEIDVLALELTPPEGFDRYFVTLVADADGTFLVETDLDPAGGAPSTEIRHVLGNLRAAFTHAGLILDVEKGTLAASFGGQEEVLIVEKAVSKGSRLAIGASWANNTKGTFFVNMDNVVVDQQ